MEKSAAPSEDRNNDLLEKRILDLARKGDIQAFEKLVKLYQKKVLSLAYRIVRNPEDARDVAQEVFLRVYRFLPGHHENRQFFTWLYRITVNASFDHLKREKRFRSMPLEDIADYTAEDPVSEQNSKERAEKLIEIIHSCLSDVQRTAMLLREVEGFSCREIAKILECSEVTVRSHLFHARKHLKNWIENHYPELLEDKVL